MPPLDCCRDRPQRPAFFCPTAPWPWSPRRSETQNLCLSSSPQETALGSSVLSPPPSCQLFNTALIETHCAPFNARSRAWVQHQVREDLRATETFPRTSSELSFEGGRNLFWCRPQGKAFQGKGPASIKVLRCDSLDPWGKHRRPLVLGAQYVPGSWEQRWQSLRVRCGWRGSPRAAESGGRVLDGRVTQSVFTFTMLVMRQICWLGGDSGQRRPWRPRKEPSSPGSQSSQVICASDRPWPSARAWHHGPGQLSSAGQAFWGTVSAPNSLWKRRPAHLPVGNRKGISHNVAP